MQCSAEDHLHRPCVLWCCSCSAEAATTTSRVDNSSAALRCFSFGRCLVLSIAIGVVLYTECTNKTAMALMTVLTIMTRSKRNDNGDERANDRFWTLEECCVVECGRSARQRLSYRGA